MKQKATINKVIKEVQLNGKNKVDKKDHGELEKRLDAFCELEHMRYLKGTLVPRIEKFSSNVGVYESTLADM